MARNPKRFIPYFLVCLILVLGIFFLWLQGRFWICTCNEIFLWSGDIWSSNNSQHIADPYSFSHILHGLIFFGVLTLFARGLPFSWKLMFSVLIESAWEVLENSSLVINRYRQVTASLGYTGDTIINSLFDILFCILGVFLARKLGLWKSIVLFIMIEIVMLAAIRDNFTLNVLMLVWPIEVVREWQMVGH